MFISSVHSLEEWLVNYISIFLGVLLDSLLLGHRELAPGRAHGGRLDRYEKHCRDPERIPSGFQPQGPRSPGQPVFPQPRSTLDVLVTQPPELYPCTVSILAASDSFPHPCWHWP